jgi:hypothetical protein
VAAVAVPVQAQPGPGGAGPSLAGLSTAEKARRSAEDLSGMRSALKDVGARAEAARQAKDVVRLNCVNERLTQIRAFLKVAEQAGRASQEAAARRDPSVDVELAKVEVARSKVDALRAESEKCVGLVAYAAEEERTKVEVQEPKGLPEPGVEWGVDARPAPAPPPVVRPAPASAFQ